MQKIILLCCYLCCSFKNPQSFLYKNLLYFYNTVILTYLQVLHKNQQYQQIVPFMYGPYLKNKPIRKIVKELETSNFGYAIKRVGIKNQGNQKWSLTYRKTLIGTFENFKINCMLIKDTCLIYVDQKQWNILFK